MEDWLIEIREEEKKIPRKYVAEAIGVCDSTLARWISAKKIQHPSGQQSKFTRGDIEKVFSQLSKKRQSKMRRNMRRRFNTVLNSELVLESGGVFTKAETSTWSAGSWADTIDDMGLWNAQGINNHEHLEGFTSNPVFELFLAEKIIEAWIKKLRQLSGGKKFVIYWNGKIHSTICIYTITEQDYDKLNSFDAYLGMEKTILHHLT
jgi:hypothetical protein